MGSDLTVSRCCRGNKVRQVGRHRERHTRSVICARDVPDSRRSSRGGSRKEKKQVLLTKPIVLVCTNRGRNDGGHQQSRMDFLCELGRRITQRTDDQRESAFLFQRLSMLIQRTNAVDVLGIFPNTTPRTKCSLSSIVLVFSLSF